VNLNSFIIINIIFLPILMDTLISMNPVLLAMLIVTNL